jgi:hypothetical protein
VKKHTQWSFSTKYDAIDLDRILAETPPECRVVEVVIGPGAYQRIMYVRKTAYDRACAAGLPLDTRSCGLTGIQRRVMPDHTFRSAGTSLDGWLVAEHHQPMASLAEVLGQLELVDAHYVEQVRVTCRAG